MNRRPRALISACLLGVNCRYNGEAKRCPGIEALTEALELIPICPEQLGGLPTPRLPSERLGERVLTRDGSDVTDAFTRGAAQTCALAALFHAEYAILKARSPSCGSGEIYDGSFSGRTVPGDGIAAKALKNMGVRVYDETQLQELLDALKDTGE